METLSFWIWLISILTIAGFGLGAMLFAYWGKGSVTVIFDEPLMLPASQVSDSNPEAEAQFQQGCAAYQQGHYRRAIHLFSQAIQLDPQFGMAYHNRGRAVANLRRVTDALGDLVKASDLYLQQEQTAELALLKQDLATLKAKK